MAAEGDKGKDTRSARDAFLQRTDNQYRTHLKALEKAQQDNQREAEAEKRRQMAPVGGRKLGGAPVGGPGTPPPRRAPFPPLAPRCVAAAHAIRRGVCGAALPFGDEL